MFYGPSSYISTSMILGDGGQMLMVTEEQDHEYLENGKRYHFRLFWILKSQLNRRIMKIVHKT